MPLDRCHHCLSNARIWRNHDLERRWLFHVPRGERLHQIAPPAAKSSLNAFESFLSTRRRFHTNPFEGLSAYIGGSICSYSQVSSASVLKLRGDHRLSFGTHYQVASPPQLVHQIRLFTHRLRSSASRCHGSCKISVYPRRNLLPYALFDFSEVSLSVDDPDQKLMW